MRGVREEGREAKRETGETGNTREEESRERGGEGESTKK